MWPTVSVPPARLRPPSVRAPPFLRDPGAALMDPALLQIRFSVCGPPFLLVSARMLFDYASQRVPHCSHLPWVRLAQSPERPSLGWGCRDRSWRFPWRLLLCEPGDLGTRARSDPGGQGGGSRRSARRMSSCACRAHPRAAFAGPTLFLSFLFIHSVSV